ncbi:MAG: dihydrodipicolinate reductase [Deltaproteobacteria bacterium]|nr:dihydrodipicolinate reductase [Deltaproteobacteria bacterium]
MVLVGLGPTGLAIARAVLETPDLRIVGAVDPAHQGRTLAEVLGGPAPSVTIAADPARILGSARGGVLLHAVGGDLDDAEPLLTQAVRAGLTVVSTCEELCYPWLAHEKLAERLDKLAESRDVAVLATGVTPGFALDRLPGFLSQVTGPVRHLRAVRVVDAAAASPGQAGALGIGLEAAAFDEASDRGDLGQPGMAQSAALAALGCGFELDEVEESLEPVLAEAARPGPPAVARGAVAGVRHSVRGFVDGAERVQLTLRVEVGAADPHDEVELDARPPLSLRIPGGVPGLEATAWAVVNAAAPATLLRGLVTVLDLPAGR